MVNALTGSQPYTSGPFEHSLESTAAVHVGRTPSRSPATGFPYSDLQTSIVFEFPILINASIAFSHLLSRLFSSDHQGASPVSSW